MPSRLRAAANAVYRRLRVAPKAWEAYILSLTPAAWYRYNTGITQAGGFVSQWADQSGNSNHLLQATGTNQPAVDANGVITFDGIDNFMRASFTLNQPCTAYIVFNPITAIATNAIMSGAINGTAFAFLRWSAAGTQIGAGAPTLSGLIPTSAGVWIADSVVLNAAAGEHTRYNGEINSSNNNGTNNAGGVTLATHQTTVPTAFTNIAVKEVIVFPAAHNTATQYLVLAYLSSLL